VAGEVEKGRKEYKKIKLEKNSSKKRETYFRIAININIP
jgi:hypothetical protein